ncbi:pyrroloquinoline quinone biosynthesis protein PqqF, partial [Pseudomonas sp. CrR25]|nr:pyrroloquinoline quinone biosynthesis protein PqqF [Pseudomonas sp. CrR25]
EPREYPGLAHFLEHLLFIGGAQFTGEQRLMPFVQACGGQVNATTQARHTDFFCEVPAAQLGEALERLLDMLTAPLPGQAAQLRERDVVHAEFLARAQDAETLVSAALGQALAAGHGCGAFVAGNRDSLPVERATFQQALAAFHRRGYQAGGVSLVLVGPQSVAELQSLAEGYGGALPGGVIPVPVAAASLLPLRARQLRLCLAGAPSLQLGFALESSTQETPAALDEALSFLRTWLMDASPGGLLAGLRAAGWCADLQARVAYRHERQALLQLAFSGVAESGTGRARLAAALQDWLGFFSAVVMGSDLASRYETIQHWRRHSLPPLALARHWQARLASGRAPRQGLGADGMRVLSEVLAQMQAAERRIGLSTGPDEAAPWSGAGFALRMEVEVLPPIEERRRAWRLPASNPLLALEPGPAPAADIALHWRWLPDQGQGQGALHWRWCLGERLPAAELQALVQTRLAEVQAQVAQLGVSLRLIAEDDSLQLCVLGPATLLPRSLALVLARLLQPDAGPACRPRSDGTPAQMPIRQLLGRLPELFAPPPNTALPWSADWLSDLLRQARMEGQGCGLDHAGRAALEGLFGAVAELPTTAPSPGCRPGRHWRHVELPSEESALLLFCPQPAADATREAGWRLLAQLYQGAFYQRLRTELQLGYALFCGYRQVLGRRGLLFAVQSPHASAAQVLGHIETFLAAQEERLAALDEEAVALAARAVARQLEEQRATPADRAEQHWQQHLAGLAPGQNAAVQRALAVMTGQQLRRCQRALNQASGGWHVLASGGPPVRGWATPSR